MYGRTDHIYIEKNIRLAFENYPFNNLHIERTRLKFISISKQNTKQLTHTQTNTQTYTHTHRLTHNHTQTQT